MQLIAIINHTEKERGSTKKNPEASGEAALGLTHRERGGNCAGERILIFNVAEVTKKCVLGSPGRADAYSRKKPPMALCTVQCSEVLVGKECALDLGEFRFLLHSTCNVRPS